MVNLSGFRFRSPMLWIVSGQGREWQVLATSRLRALAWFASVYPQVPLDQVNIELYRRRR